MSSNSGDWADNDAVILDNGTGMMKAGFAGAEEPKAVFPAAVARNKKSSDEAKVGDDAVDTDLPRGWRIKYPVEHGIVNDWDGMELIWKKAFKDLGTTPEKQAVMITEAPLNPKANREKYCEIMFEGLDVPAMYVQIQAVLALYASGRNDGVVVDSGDGVTHTVPVYDGRVVPTCVKRSEIAGRDLTDWMMELLNEDQEFRFTTSKHKEWAKEIKEKFCYLENDFEDALEKWEEDETAFDEEHTLPDGTAIKVGRARFCCPEAIFKPDLMDRDEIGLHDLLQKSIWDCPIDARRTMLGNIVLSGGTTLFPNMENRLAIEMKNHEKVPAAAKEWVKVVSDASDEGRGIRKYTVWMGGAILASLGGFQDQWITKEEYEEHGVGICHTRCDSLSGY